MKIILISLKLDLLFLIGVLFQMMKLVNLCLCIPFLTNRLEEAGIHAKNIGLIFFGDPAQILPISGLSIWSTQLKNERKKCTELSVEGHGYVTFRFSAWV